MTKTVNKARKRGNICAETVPTPRQGARAFARWYIGQAPIWPMELRRLGTFAMLALQTFDSPRQPYATELIQAERDLAAFQDAYTAHMASRQ